jgi:hypothetical protein
MRSTVDRVRRAAALGSDVPRGEFPLCVHSVFHAALNFTLPNGEFLTLLSAEADDLPRSVRLASEEDLLSLGLSPGDGGVFTLDEIVLEPSVGGRRVRVDCAGAPRLAAQSAPPLRGEGKHWRAGVARLEALQARAATDLRVASLLSEARPFSAMGERLTQAAFDLGRGVQTGRFDAMRGAAARLVGLGPGLTPAGDDFLCGFFAAGHCRRAGGLACARLLTSLAEAVQDVIGQTTDISASFLRDALAGRVSRPLAALAEACAGAPGSDLGGALLHLAAVGHSSGLDAATGFFYGETVWGRATGLAERAPRASRPTIRLAGRPARAATGG